MAVLVFSAASSVSFVPEAVIAALASASLLRLFVSGDLDCSISSAWSLGFQGLPAASCGAYDVTSVGGLGFFISSFLFLPNPRVTWAL